jgi:hypothetical protein
MHIYSMAQSEPVHCKLGIKSGAIPFAAALVGNSPHICFERVPHLVRNILWALTKLKATPLLMVDLTCPACRLL